MTWNGRIRPIPDISEGSVFEPFRALPKTRAEAYFPLLSQSSQAGGRGQSEQLPVDG